MLSHSFIVLSFEKHLERLFLVIRSSSSQALDKDITLLIFLDVELRLSAVLEQVHQCLVVELEI